MNRRRRRVTYRPSKGEAAFAGVVGVIFVLIGIFAVIPTFGAFGVLWTLVSAGITGMNLYRAFGSRYVGPEIRIEDETGEGEPLSPAGPGVQARLEQLNKLREQELITQEEYEEKRKEILKEL